MKRTNSTDLHKEEKKIKLDTSGLEPMSLIGLRDLPFSTWDSIADLVPSIVDFALGNGLETNSLTLFELLIRRNSHPKSKIFFSDKQYQSINCYIEYCDIDYDPPVEFE